MPASFTSTDSESEINANGNPLAIQTGRKPLYWCPRRDGKAWRSEAEESCYIKGFRELTCMGELVWSYRYGTDNRQALAAPPASDMVGRA